MAVSGTMALSAATFSAGSAAITTQRGTQTWGANYVFNPSGLQNDILVMSDLQASGSFTGGASGTMSVGTKAAPLVASGIVMNALGGAPYAIVISVSGTLSAVAL